MSNPSGSPDQDRKRWIARGHYYSVTYSSIWVISIGLLAFFVFGYVDQIIELYRIIYLNQDITSALSLVAAISTVSLSLFFSCSIVMSKQLEFIASPSGGLQKSFCE